MHQIVQRLELRLRPTGGAHGVPPDPHCWQMEGEEGKGRGTDGRGRNGKRGRERRRGCLLLTLNLSKPLHSVIEPHVTPGAVL